MRGSYVFEIMNRRCSSNDPCMTDMGKQESVLYTNPKQYRSDPIPNAKMPALVSTVTITAKTVTVTAKSPKDSGGTPTGTAKWGSSSRGTGPHCHSVWPNHFFAWSPFSLFSSLFDLIYDGNSENSGINSEFEAVRWCRYFCQVLF